MFGLWIGAPRTCQAVPDAEDPGDDPRPLPRPLSDDDPWDAFVPDDDFEPDPEPGDFWIDQD